MVKRITTFFKLNLIKNLLALGCSLVLISSNAVANEPPPAQDRPISLSEKNNIVDRLIAELDDQYIFPEKLSQFKQRVRLLQQKKDYQEQTSATYFAFQINIALEKTIGDGHLHLSYSERKIPQENPSKADTEKQRKEELAFMRSLNWGIEKVQRLPFNIGYIDISMFADPKHAQQTIAAAMTLVSNTQGLIIDLRFSRGGDPETVALIASYFLDDATHLSDIYDRKENSTQSIWTEKLAEQTRYGEQRPLYILTSRDTFSAAEDFSYSLKHLKRAKIIGEVTGGGAHPGDFVRLADHFEIFIPSARSINSITQTNWEGVGVIPDRKVDASRALEVANIDLLEYLMAVEKDPRRQARMQAKIDKMKSKK